MTTSKLRSWSPPLSSPLRCSCSSECDPWARAASTKDRSSTHPVSHPGRRPTRPSAGREDLPGVAVRERPLNNQRRSTRQPLARAVASHLPKLLFSSNRLNRRLRQCPSLPQPKVKAITRPASHPALARDRRGLRQGVTAQRMLLLACLHRGSATAITDRAKSSALLQGKGDQIGGSRIQRGLPMLYADGQSFPFLSSRLGPGCLE